MCMMGWDTRAKPHIHVVFIPACTGAARGANANWFTPKEYNSRMHDISGAGAITLSMISCNSVYRGFDIDEVAPLLLCTCGTTIYTFDDMELCLKEFSLETTSIRSNDPLPFTMQCVLLAVTKRQGDPWSAISCTAN